MLGLGLKGFEVGGSSKGGLVVLSWVLVALGEDPIAGGETTASSYLPVNYLFNVH